MIFITGSDGFVGKALCLELSKRKIPYKAGARSSYEPSQVSYGDIVQQNNWEAILHGIDTVVHLAARVHIMNDSSQDPLREFRKINTEATVKLAQAAKASGVKRFIFVSTIKVNGERTFEKPFKSSDTPSPEDAYGISKKEAEEALLKMHISGEFEVVIIRPPLIYGPGVKANFSSLMKIASKGIPLPFGLVSNKRSFVSVFNLVDFIILTTIHPKAGGKVFLVADGEDLSLKELITRLAKVQDRKAFLFPVPLSLLKTGFILLGKKSINDRLFGNLQVDISDSQKILQWSAPFTLETTFKEK